MINFIKGLINYARYNGVSKIGPERLPVKFNVSKPVFPITIGDSVKWEGIVIHCTATPDDTKADNTAAIKTYHTSFRIDYTIVAAPLTPEQIRTLPKARLYPFNDRVYDSDQVEVFFARQREGEGKRFELPWKECGYHLILERENDMLQVDYGRPFTMAGAHAGVDVNGKINSYFNQKYIGMSHVGIFEKEPPDKALWDFSLSITRYLVQTFNMKIENVIGHREVFTRLGVPVQKPCPGTMWDMEKYRREI